MKAVLLATENSDSTNRSDSGNLVCLSRFGLTRLMDHYIQVLKEAGIDEIIIITGSESGRLKELYGNRCRVISNHLYYQTNDCYSIWLANQHVYGKEFLIFNANVFYDDHLIADFIDHDYQTLCLIDLYGNHRLTGQNGGNRGNDSACLQKLRRSSALKADFGQMLKFNADDSKLFLAKVTWFIINGYLDKTMIEPVENVLKHSAMYPYYNWKTIPSSRRIVDVNNR